jgi:hypothetical protein
MTPQRSRRHWIRSHHLWSLLSTHPVTLSVVPPLSRIFSGCHPLSGRLTTRQVSWNLKNRTWSSGNTFTVGLASITPVCWPQCTLASPYLPHLPSLVCLKNMKRHNTRTVSLYSFIFISLTKWNEMFVYY